MKDQITFNRDEKLPHPAASHITVTKKIYTALTKEAAIDFLGKQKVTEQFYYIEIDTPSGRFGTDIEGKIYDKNGTVIEVDEQIINTKKINLELINFKTVHPISIQSITFDNENALSIGHLTIAEISERKGDLYINIGTWDYDSDPKFKDDTILNLIFIDNNKKFQCKTKKAWGASCGGKTEYTLVVVDKIILLS